MSGKWIAQIVTWLVNGYLRKCQMEPRVMLGKRMVLVDNRTGRVVAGLRGNHPVWEPVIEEKHR